MALEGKAPAIFRRCTKGGVPVYAVALTAMFGLLGFLCVQEGKTQEAFDWVSCAISHQPNHQSNTASKSSTISQLSQVSLPGR